MAFRNARRIVPARTPDLISGSRMFNATRSIFGRSSTSTCLTRRCRSFDLNRAIILLVKAIAPSWSVAGPSGAAKSRTAFTKIISLRVRLDQTKLLPEFVMAIINSGHGQAYFRSKAKRTTNLASINSKEVAGLPIPLLPIMINARYCREAADNHVDCGHQTYRSPNPARLRLDRLRVRPVHDQRQPRVACRRIDPAMRAQWICPARRWGRRRGGVRGEADRSTALALLFGMQGTD